MRDDGLAVQTAVQCLRSDTSRIIIIIVGSDGRSRFRSHAVPCSSRQQRYYHYRHEQIGRPDRASSSPPRSDTS